MDDLISRWSVRQALFGCDYLLGDFFDLKNDEDKVKTVLQYLLTYEKMPDIPRESKNAKIASEHIVRANRNFQSLPWQSLVEIYTKAVIHAPLDSVELVQAYANRAAALYSSGLYDDCRMDMKRSLEIGYRDDMKTELIRRQQFILEKNVIIDRELNEITDANGKYMTISLNDLPMEFPSTGLDKKFDFEIFLPQVPHDNPEIMHASAAIKLGYSKKYGRQVTATRNIEAGEVFLVHKSYASIIEPHLMHKNCWHCSKRVWSGVPCHDCVSIIYCNEACRDQAWQQHHDIECPVIVAMLNAKMGVSDFMSLRLTVKAYKEAGTFQQLERKLHEIDAIQGCPHFIFNSNTGN